MSSKKLAKKVLITTLSASMVVVVKLFCNTCG